MPTLLSIVRTEEGRGKTDRQVVGLQVWLSFPLSVKGGGIPSSHHGEVSMKMKEATLQSMETQAEGAADTAGSNPWTNQDSQSPAMNE